MEGLVRNRLLDSRFELARQRHIEELKKQIPVQIDEAALQELQAGSP